MSSTVQRLLDRRTALVTQMREVAERAADESRDLSAEEDRQFTEMNAEVDALEKRANAILEGEKRAKDIEDSFAKLSGRPVDGTRSPAEQQRTDELRSFLEGTSRQRYFDVHPQGQRDVWTSPEQRTLSKLSAGAGSATVPQSFYSRLVEHMVEATAVLGISNVINTDSGETLPVPKTTSHGGAAAVAEAGTLAASDPAFGVVNLGAYKFGQLVQVSRELVTDTGVDLEGYLARACGRNLGLALGPKLVTGTGSSEPRGVVTDATQGVLIGNGIGGVTAFGSQATANQGADFLIDLFYSVIAPYRNSASAAWLVKDSTAGVIRKLKDSTGEYVYQPMTAPGAVDRILGKPVYTDPNMAALGANAKSVLWGDWSQFFIRVAGPIRFERSDEFAFSTDLVSFRAVLRADAALVDLTGALKYLQNAAS